MSKENEDTFVYADLGRIIQVVSNLLSNTIQFTEVESVTVKMKRERDEITMLLITIIED